VNRFETALKRALEAKPARAKEVPTKGLGAARTADLLRSETVGRMAESMLHGMIDVVMDGRWVGGTCVEN